MKSIVLPAGTEHVQFGELAHLIADALWPDAGPDDDRMTYEGACTNLDAELARAVVSGALPVKDPLTLGPHTYPVGYALKTALVTVDDLQRFVSDRLSVIVETPERQAADAPAANVGTNKKAWDDSRLRALWEESFLPGVTKTSLGVKYGVSRQRISTLLNDAKDKFRMGNSSPPSLLSQPKMRKY